jgi:hypothetical protein
MKKACLIYFLDSERFRIFGFFCVFLDLHGGSHEISKPLKTGGRTAGKFQALCFQCLAIETLKQVHTLEKKRRKKNYLDTLSIRQFGFLKHPFAHRRRIYECGLIEYRSNVT